jgi:hypothetical protein
VLLYTTSGGEALYCGHSINCISQAIHGKTMTRAIVAESERLCKNHRATKSEEEVADRERSTGQNGYLDRREEMFAAGWASWFCSPSLPWRSTRQMQAHHSNIINEALRWRTLSSVVVSGM